MALGLSWTSVLLLILIILLSIAIMGLFSFKNHLPVEGRTVLITGASQGMGKSAACQISSRGANVIIVARDTKKLAAALTEIKAAAKNPTTQRFLSISADVTLASENTRILAESTAWNNGFPPDIVWQIAGASKPTLLLDSSLDTMHAQMDLNYWAAVYLARETMTAWLAASSCPQSSQSSSSSSSSAAEPLPRHIILTTSIAAMLGVAGYAPYCPAKAAMRSFADAMRSELNLYNGARRQADAHRDPAYPPPPTEMHIHLVVPGTIDSPGLQLENESKHDITNMIEEVDPVQHPDAVARGAIRGLEGGQYIVIPHWFNRFMAGSSWQGSPRSSMLVDTVLGLVTGVAWLFVGPDLERQVWNYGKRWGLKGRPKGHKGWT
ncbi:putative oxidoreductase,short chain dehydrogenase [Pseudovirgaria hyperparasitica]|uniref:3-dehydrosphinganine reductase n=1 Tax=Pseudovirgaria hyperparasitica TaxID=470096 RepID=A0A6A6WIH3_9PEZI|nr:putative oxidoreductase,short chain dehydrogenase [Pseudovirgaria hyperparasitica]KAF2761925.1 putative oxidoreductase,short chain dehydrogenase [Pseudovirgaria hyperparasitica]